jgi:hypothetical protein
VLERLARLEATVLQMAAGSKVATERRDVNKEIDSLSGSSHFSNTYQQVNRHKLKNGVESPVGSDSEIGYIDSKTIPSTGIRYEEKGVSPLERGPAQKPASTTIFDFKTIFKDDGKVKDKYQLIVKGDGLKQMLEKVLKPYLVHENTRWTGGDVIFTEPFAPLIYHIKDLKEAADGREAGEHTAEVDRNALKDLLRHIEVLLPNATNYREEAFTSRKVTNAGIWAIFRPGTLVVAHPFLDEPQIFRVQRHGPSKLRPGASAVTCTAYDWNGKSLERKNYEFSINKFEDEIPIRDLPCYPVELYDEGLETLKSRLGKRGQRFQEICRDNMQLKKEYKYEDAAIPGSQTIDQDSGMPGLWSGLVRTK